MDRFTYSNGEGHQYLLPLTDHADTNKEGGENSVSKELAA